MSGRWSRAEVAARSCLYPQATAAPRRRTRWRPDASDYFYFAFYASGSIDGTGRLPADEIRWDNGTESRPIPGGGAVQMPNRFTGQGVLTIVRYDQGIAQRHLAGTIEGRLQQPRGGDVVEVEADFDVNLPCGALP